MVEVTATSFADLLKQYRVASGLTQEELAEQAGLSTRAISDLERGVKQRPYAHTVQQLVQALGLEEGKAACFRHAARRPGGRDDEPAESRPLVRPSLSLPLQPTPFIGRQQEIEEVEALLRLEGVHLLTLTGPGGVGKTRLAVRVAEEMQHTFPDGVVFVSLASLVDPGQVASTVATSLKTREVSGEPILESLIEHLSEKRLLLLLDNFEHLLPAAEVLSHLLATCPHLKILVTSRAALHLAAEYEYPVRRLPVPALMHRPPLDALARYDAVEIFVQRARAVKPDFRMTEGNAASIAEICRRLDGLPLAIELAAARARVLPPAALLQRLEHRLRLLTGGPRDVPGRQQTMRDTIAWSYDLLNDVEQRLFRRLVVFVGGCDLEAAELVCNADGAIASDMLDGLTSLVDKHLLTVEDLAGEEPRFQMLETIREYGLERLEASGETEPVLREHAGFFLMLAEEAALELQGPDQGWWLAVLEREHDNLRAALRWARQHEETEIELRLAIGLSRFWHRRGYLREGRAWLEAALATPGVADSGVRAEALNYAGIFAQTQGDYDRAIALHQQSLALARELDHRDAVADSLNNLGVIALDRGEYERALPLLEESLAIARELKDRAKVARGLHNLAEAAIGRGEYEQAESLFEESLKLYQELGSKQFVAGTLRHLGRLKTLCGEYDRAMELCKEALILAGEVGGMYLVPLCLETLAAVAGGAGKVDRAVRLWGAADALRAATGVPLEPVERLERESCLTALRGVLLECAFVHRWEEGQAMTPDRAVAYALGVRNSCNALSGRHDTGVPADHRG